MRIAQRSRTRPCGGISRGEALAAQQSPHTRPAPAIALAPDPGPDPEPRPRRSNASTTESQWDYRFLSIRAWLAWADISESLGNLTGAAHWRAYAASGAAFVRAQLGDATWTAPGVLGVHAAAEALNTPGFASAAEAAALVANQLNNQATICSQSNFNSYWILQGLGNGGALDRAVAKVRCTAAGAAPLSSAQRAFGR